MFHGWLNIDKIESWDEQGKNGENTQLAYGWVIDSHCISECFFTLNFLRICPRANGSSSSNSTQAKFSTRIEMTMMIMRWTACTSIITHITQRVSIIFVFFSLQFMTWTFIFFQFWNFTHIFGFESQLHSLPDLEKSANTFPRCNICHVLYPDNWRSTTIVTKQFFFCTFTRFSVIVISWCTKFFMWFFDGLHHCICLAFKIS